MKTYWTTTNNIKHILPKNTVKYKRYGGFSDLLVFMLVFVVVVVVLVGKVRFEHTCKSLKNCNILIPFMILTPRYLHFDMEMFLFVRLDEGRMKVWLRSPNTITKGWRKRFWLSHWNFILINSFFPFASSSNSNFYKRTNERTSCKSWIKTEEGKTYYI